MPVAVAASSARAIILPLVVVPLVLVLPVMGDFIIILRDCDLSLVIGNSDWMIRID